MSNRAKEGTQHIPNKPIQWTEMTLNFSPCANSKKKKTKEAISVSANTVIQMSKSNKIL